jgi:hypothetical protein
VGCGRDDSALERDGVLSEGWARRWWLRWTFAECHQTSCTAGGHGALSYRRSTPVLRPGLATTVLKIVHCVCLNCSELLPGGRLRAEGVLWGRELERTLTRMPASSPSLPLMVLMRRMSIRTDE